METTTSKDNVKIKNEETIPATPESTRRKKKQRDRDIVPPPPSSLKKKRNSKSRSPPVSDESTPVSTRTRSTTPAAQRKSPQTKQPSDTKPLDKYVKLNPGIEDTDIRAMSKSNLSQELSKIATLRNITLSKEVILNASRNMLIRRAITFKRLSQPLRKPNKPSVTADTTDAEIEAMKAEICRPIYIESLKDRGIPVDKDSIDLLKPIEFHARLLNYRDYLVEQRSELEKKMIAKVLYDTNSYKRTMTTKSSDTTSKTKTKSPNPQPVQSSPRPAPSEKAQDTVDVEMKEQNEISNSTSTQMPHDDKKLQNENTTKPTHTKGDNKVTQTKSFAQQVDKPTTAQNLSSGKSETNEDKSTHKHNETEPANGDSNIKTESHTTHAASETEAVDPKNTDTSVFETTNDTSTNASNDKQQRNSTKRSKRKKRDRRATPSTNTSPFPKMDATHVSRVTTDATPQGKHPLIKERLPKALTTCEFTVRTRWVGKFFQMGIQICARMLINLIREVDPYMTVLPAGEDGDTHDSENFITHEDDFDDDRYTTWVRNPWCIINTANEFAMQFRCTKTFKCMKEKIIEFMAETGNGVKIDCNKADRVVTIGFFDNFHQHFHNKNQLRLYCKKFLKEKFDCDYHIEVYPRKYYVGHGKNLVKGTLISLEVGYSHAETVNNAMLRCSFEGYTEIRYVPFTKHDEHYNALMRKILHFHTTVNQRLEVIRIPKFNYDHSGVKFKSDKFKNVRELIMSFNNQNRHFVYDVSKGNGFSTNIIYNIDSETHLEDFIQGFKQLLMDHIEDESFKKMYFVTKPLMNVLNTVRRKSVYERDHVQQMFQKYGIYDGVNEQDPVPTIVNKIKDNCVTHHNKPRRPLPGATQKATMPEETQPNKQVSYADTVTGEKANTNSENGTLNAPISSYDNQMDFELTQPPVITPPASQSDDNSETSTETTKSQKPSTPQRYQQDFVTKSDLKQAVTEALKSQAPPPDNAIKLINDTALKLRDEMKQDRKEMEGKIEDISNSIATELTKATEPFTSAIKSLQSSQQQFFGLFQHLLLPQMQQQHQLPMLTAPSNQPFVQPTPTQPLSSTAIQMLNQPIQHQHGVIHQHPSQQNSGTANQIPPNMPTDPAIRLTQIKIEPGANI